MSAASDWGMKNELLPNTNFGRSDFGSILGTRYGFWLGTLLCHIKIRALKILTQPNTSAW